MGGHGTEVEGKSKLSGMFSQKKPDNKFLKTQKKLPDLQMGQVEGQKK